MYQIVPYNISHLFMKKKHGHHQESFFIQVLEACMCVYSEVHGKVCIMGSSCDLTFDPSILAPLFTSILIDICLLKYIFLSQIWTKIILFKLWWRKLHIPKHQTYFS